MNREQALAILDLPRSQARAAIVALWEKADQWNRLQAASVDNAVSPTTPSGMQPVYLKPCTKRRHKKPGRKPGHLGVCRPNPEHIDVQCEHHITSCPKCGTAVDKPIRQHTRLTEDIAQVTPQVTAHTIHGYWCGQCTTIVTPKVTAALPRSRLGLRFVVYTAWLHYLVGVSVGNCVKTAAVALGFRVSPGGLTLAWHACSRMRCAWESSGKSFRHPATLGVEQNFSDASTSSSRAPLKMRMPNASSSACVGTGKRCSLSLTISR